ncbi:hypothetical protein [Methylobacterium sp. WL2]|uniref:hypothetical protein n=1 Tax=Methylobacterium sp. WL2 TaxID=2603902 RepID=UPI0011CB721E|nr:hypothetical protein [Methylobacterium sp. WL2]TXN56580.1 hypothetical protein FV241_14725 [Methylobacterium sp. WL2]
MRPAAGAHPEAIPTHEKSAIVRRETSDFRTDFAITGDDASLRKLQDLLAGKAVPTGRIVEVTYRVPDGSTEKQRHAEFGQIDRVSYDPAPVTGGVRSPRPRSSR